MNAYVRFRVGGRVVQLGPGDVIGRLTSAALRLDDPRVSEAHALVSLRGDELKLLSLRGRLWLGETLTSEIVLKPGARVGFAPGVALEVVAVVLPDELPALEGDELPRQVLPPIASLFATRGELVPGFSADADALLWSDGDRYRLRRPTEADRELAPDAEFVAGGRAFRMTNVALARTGIAATARDDRLDAPLTLVVRFDTVHVHRGAEVLAIDGVPARIISELAAMRAPVEWRTLARELWGTADGDDGAQRDRWDAALSRLRKRLRELQIRLDLVRTDGHGLVELMLGPNDRIQDET